MIAWAVESLIAITLLMLLVLAVRRPVARLFGAEWAYALWLLPLLRLILPPLPFDGGGILFVIPPDAAFIPAAGESAAPTPPLGGPGQWVPLLALWAGGAAVFIIWQLVSYRNFLAALGSGMRPAAITSFGGIPVIESDAAVGPLAVGIVDRRIVVPPLFNYRYTPGEQELALSHELVHHRRGDLIWNSAGLLVLALNWFNPVAYFAFRAFRADQELACDARIARRSPAQRHEYASALIKSASRPGQIAACPLGPRRMTISRGSLRSADQLKRRLKMMKTHGTSKMRRLSGAATLAALLVAGLGLSAPGFAQEQEEQQSGATRQDVIIKHVRKDGHGKIVEGKSLAELVAKCGSGNKEEADVRSGEGKQKFRTRVIICDEKHANSAEAREKLATALEKARAALSENEALSEKGRAQAAEALDREIARLRSQGR
jgi:beta-lactamase regulating signal transducer with metallopeptidase domain